jgi:hypothetical protein
MSLTLSPEFLDRKKIENMPDNWFNFVDLIVAWILKNSLPIEARLINFN